MQNANQYDNQVEIEAKRRFQSFKLGKPAPPFMTAPSITTKHQHRRSHSRNASVVSISQSKFYDNSTTTSLSSHNSTPSIASLSSQSHASLPSSASLPSHLSNGSVSSKRNSHHRRRSSVSTRVESAELMGVSLPDMPKTTSNGYGSGSDDDKDSIRRRALWALEGKTSQMAMGFQKVEIPDMNTIDSISTEKALDFPSKPPHPQVSSFSSNSHRDSFKIKHSSSTKDQLHTLVEEEEEEDEDPPRSPATPSTAPPLSPRSMFMKRHRTMSSPSHLTSPTLSTPTSPLKPTYAEKLTQPPAPLETKRPRPLSLRPLSLTPESISLPTPLTSSTSTTTLPKGFKTLSLVTPTEVPVKTQRPVLHINPEVKSPSYAHVVASTSSTSSSFTSSSSSGQEKVKPPRRSSISYKSSGAHGLPTPDQTPTWNENRFSASSISTTTSEESEGFFRDSSHTSNTSNTSHSTSSWTHRSLSASEQHFLFKSHNALLTRIQDLERALSVRVRRERELVSRRDSLSPSPNTSRPLSTGSDISSVSDEGTDGPSDELLSMIRDLKSERDELKRDVEGWRRRVGESEKTISVLSKRVETERREAWVARGRVGVVVQEKEILERQVEGERREKDEALDAVKSAKEDRERLSRKVKERDQKLMEVEEECSSLRQQLARLRTEKDEEISRLQHELSLVRTKPQTSPFAGFDTDVDEDADISLEDNDNSADYDAEAEEEAEEEDEYEEEDVLAGYEDEDPLDLEDSTFSDDDTEDFRPIRTAVEVPSTPRAQVPQHTLPTPPSTGLQMGWKFPSKVVDSPATPTQQSQPTRGHRAARSLSMPWTFPKANGPTSTLSNSTVPTPSVEDEEEEVDRFFGCLEDSSSAASSPPTSLASLEEPFDYERKNAFTSGLRSLGLGINLGLGIEDESFDEEEPFPFELKGAGVEIPRTSSIPSSPKVSAVASLDVVAEEDEEEDDVSEDTEDDEDEDEDEDDEDEDEDDEDEDDEDDGNLEIEIEGEMEMGGIKFTFTPPKDEDEFSFSESGSPEYSGHNQEEESSKTTLSEVVSPDPVLETPPPVSRTASVPIPIMVFDEPEDSEEEEEERTFRVGPPKPAAFTPSRVTPPKASSIPIPRSSSFRFPSAPATPPTLIRSASASSVFSSSRSNVSTPPTSLYSRSPSPSKLPRLSSSPSGSIFGGRVSPSDARSASPSTNAFVTPPNKRGGIMSPSLIPQPSPSKRPSSPSWKPITTAVALGENATFIRQPKRQTSLSNKCKPSAQELYDDFASNAIMNDEEHDPATPRASSFSFPASSSVGSSFKSLSSFMPSIPLASLWSPETPNSTNLQKAEKKFVSKEAQLVKLKERLKSQKSEAFCARCQPDEVAL